jgi:hypothetical protein
VFSVEGVGPWLFLLSFCFLESGLSLLRFFVVTFRCTYFKVGRINFQNQWWFSVNFLYLRIPSLSFGGDSYCFGAFQRCQEAWTTSLVIHHRINLMMHWLPNHQISNHWHYKNTGKRLRLVWVCGGGYNYPGILNPTAFVFQFYCSVALSPIVAVRPRRSWPLHSNVFLWNYMTFLVISHVSHIDLFYGSC